MEHDEDSDAERTHGSASALQTMKARSNALLIRDPLARIAGQHQSKASTLV